MGQVKIDHFNDDFQSSFLLLGDYADILDRHSQMVVITLWIGCLFLNENWPFYSRRLVPAGLITSIAYTISFLIKKLDLIGFQNMRISSGVLIVGISLCLTWESIVALVTDICFFILDSGPENNALDQSWSQQEETFEEQQLSRVEERSNAEETALLEETMSVKQTQQSHRVEIFTSTFTGQTTAVSEETMQRDGVHTSTYAEQVVSTVIEETVNQTVSSSESETHYRKCRSFTSKATQCDSSTFSDSPLSPDMLSTEKRPS